MTNPCKPTTTMAGNIHGAAHLTNHITHDTQQVAAQALTPQQLPFLPSPLPPFSLTKQAAHERLGFKRLELVDVLSCTDKDDRALGGSHTDRGRGGGGGGGCGEKWDNGRGKKAS